MVLRAIYLLLFDCMNKMLTFKHDFIIICPVMALTYMDYIQAGSVQLVRL